MGSKEQYKAQRRAKTREAAEALIDDVEFMREILKNESITSGELRRMSAQLRRLLVEGTLVKVAAPRIGKITLPTAYARPIIEESAKAKHDFVGIGPATIFGVELSCLSLVGGTYTPSEAMKSWDPSKKIYVSPEDYLKQPAIHFRGEWITRWEIIRYIANIAHGVHSGEKLDEREELLRRARFAVKISGLPNAERSIKVNLLAFDNQELPPFIDRTSIDWFLVELWSAASSLVDAPDVHQLEAYIKEEN